MAHFKPLEMTKGQHGGLRRLIVSVVPERIDRIGEGEEKVIGLQHDSP